MSDASERINRRIPPVNLTTRYQQWDEFDWRAFLNLCAARDLLHMKIRKIKLNTKIPSLDYAWNQVEIRELEDFLVEMLVAFVETAEESTLEMAEQAFTLGAPVISESRNDFSKRSWWKLFTQEFKLKRDRTVAAMVQAASYPVLDAIQSSPLRREEVVSAQHGGGRSDPHPLIPLPSKISRAAAVRIAEIDTKRQGRSSPSKPASAQDKSPVRRPWRP
ncbi:hypothetical protein AB0F46_42585 [Streptomyces sp. NPDC026665]|uniref:hypothetical protein n=1 Tax=Streptomyces sp. NPDC026665 TaxID=3154798 RepID=UPI0033EE23EA